MPPAVQNRLCLVRHKSGKTHNDIVVTPSLNRGCHEDKYMQVVSIAVINKFTNESMITSYVLVLPGMGRHIHTRMMHTCTHAHMHTHAHTHTPHTIHLGAARHVKTRTPHAHTHTYYTHTPPPPLSSPTGDSFSPERISSNLVSNTPSSRSVNRSWTDREYVTPMLSRVAQTEYLLEE